MKGRWTCALTSDVVPRTLMDGRRGNKNSRVGVRTEGVIREEERKEVKREPCQSPVWRAQRLKNAHDIPLLLQRVFQGLLSDIVILQKALMGLQRYQAQPSHGDRGAVLCWLW